MRLAIALPLLTLLALTAGCQSARSVLTEEERATLTSVQVVPVEGTVRGFGKLPMEYEVDGTNGLMGSLYTAPLGVVYGLFNYRKTEERRSRILRAAFNRARVDVEAIVDRAVRRQFGKILPLTDPPPTSETRDDDSDDLQDLEHEVLGPQLEVRYHYGIQSMSALGDGWMPWLQLDCTLTDEAGTVLWRDSSRLDAHGELEFPDPFLDRKRLRRLMKDLARRESLEMRRAMLEQ